MTETHDHLTELHRAHYIDIVQYFARRGVVDDADDLAAEVFVIAWRKLPDGLDNPRPWLFGVARKVLGNFRRTHERRHSLDVPVDDEGTHAMRNPSHSGEIAVRVDLQRAWNALAPVDQEILALTAWEGLTSAEAATALGIRRPGAAMRLSRAREHLRAQLGDAHPQKFLNSPVIEAK